MMVTMSMVMDAMLIAQMVTITAVQPPLLSEIHSQRCVLPPVPTDIMEILFSSYVRLATTHVARALLPLSAILVLLPAIES